jgi:hypothetical protein
VADLAFITHLLVKIAGHRLDFGDRQALAAQVVAAPSVSRSAGMSRSSRIVVALEPAVGKAECAPIPEPAPATRTVLPVMPIIGASWGEAGNVSWKRFRYSTP